MAVYHWRILTTSNLYALIKEEARWSKYYDHVHLFFDYKMYANEEHPSGSWKSARMIIRVMKWKWGGNRAPCACKRESSSCHQIHLVQEAMAMLKGQVEDKPYSNLSSFLFKGTEKSVRSAAESVIITERQPPLSFRRQHPQEILLCNQGKRCNQAPIQAAFRNSPCRRQDAFRCGVVKLAGMVPP